MAGSNRAESQDIQVSDIAALLLERADQLADEMTLSIQNAVAPYQKTIRPCVRPAS